MLNDTDEAKEWLEDATDKMYLAFARSNFQQEVFEAYHDLICFGTSAIMIEEDENDILKVLCKTYKRNLYQRKQKRFCRYYL